VCRDLEEEEKQTRNVAYPNAQDLPWKEGRKGSRGSDVSPLKRSGRSLTPAE